MFSQLTIAGINITWKPPGVQTPLALTILRTVGTQCTHARKRPNRDFDLLHSTLKCHLESHQQPELLNITTYASSVCFRIISRYRSCISLTFISSPQCDLNQGNNPADEGHTVNLHPYRMHFSHSKSSHPLSNFNGTLINGTSSFMSVWSNSGPLSQAISG